MGLFKKKQGGTFFGNLIAKVANKYSGGILGAKRSAALDSGDIGSINANSKIKGKTFTSFAGQAATLEGDTYNMKQPLDDVVITSPSAVRKSLDTPFDPNKSPLLNKIGDVFAKLGKDASRDTQFGIDPKILLLIAALGFWFLIVQSNKK